MIIKILCLIIAIAGLAGCDSPTYYYSKSLQPRITPLKSSSSVFVALPADTNSCPLGSARKAALALSDAARSRFATVESADQVRDLRANLQQAAAKNCDYLFESALLKWEDWNTPWNAMRDQVTIQLTTFDVRTSAILDVGIIEVAGPSGTFKDGKPEELAAPACARYLDYLLGGSLKSSPRRTLPTNEGK